MPKNSKRFNELLKKVDVNKIYSVDEAVSTVKTLASAKFDETVEIALKLNVDPRHADQMVRGSVVLPAGTGKSVRVAVIAKDPKGVMPNPKTGTVTMDVAQAVKNAKGGQVNFRVDKQGNIHAGLGKVSFSKEQLLDNLNAFVKTINKHKPATAKGKYVTHASLSLTMSPAVTLDNQEIIDLK